MSEHRTLDPFAVAFHETAVEVIYQAHGNPELSRRDLQFMRADARAAFLALDRRIVELGGSSMEWG